MRAHLENKNENFGRDQERWQDRLECRIIRVHLSDGRRQQAEEDRSGDRDSNTGLSRGTPAVAKPSI
jgi:hypothetical protein